MTKQADIKKLEKDVEELRALRARLIEKYGEKQSKKAVYGIDQEIEQTIQRIAKVEMKDLRTDTVQTW